jgi:hypothetical protein
LASLSFIVAKLDMSLFIYRRGDDVVYLLLYIEDILLTMSTTNILQRTIDALQQEFVSKNLGPLHHFLDITVERRPQGLFLHYCQYGLDILDRAGMSNCKPWSTHIDTQAKLSEDDRPLVADAIAYWSLTSVL